MQDPTASIPRPSTDRALHPTNSMNPVFGDPALQCRDDVGRVDGLPVRETKKRLRWDTMDAVKCWCWLPWIAASREIAGWSSGRERWCAAEHLVRLPGYRHDSPCRCRRDEGRSRGSCSSPSAVVGRKPRDLGSFHAGTGV